MFESAQNQALVQQNIDQINRASATYLQALQSGGAQAVAAGLQPLAMGTQQATQDVYNQQIAREQNAALNLAAADERAIRRGTDFYESRLDETRGARSGGLQNIFGGASSLAKTLVDATSGTRKGKKESDDDGGSMAIGETESGFFDELGLRGREMENGGMVTGGKFDHNTNPIDIVKKGKKIGEMTGGEVILNPAQQKKLSKESVYFRQLLKKFNKQK
jgi:hypothetical protein